MNPVVNLLWLLTSKTDLLKQNFQKNEAIDIQGIMANANNVIYFVASW